MQKIILLCVGRIKIRWIADGYEDYLGRLKHHCTLEIIELPASKERDPKKQMEDESKRALKAIEKFDGDIWLLDEKGERMNSQEFSFLLEQARDAGLALTFILGGAYGFTPELKRRCSKRLRLSDMTLPHELARIVFLEQLYRGFEIVKGSGYHH